MVRETLTLWNETSHLKREYQLSDISTIRSALTLRYDLPRKQYVALIIKFVDDSIVTFDAGEWEIMFF